MRVDRIIRSQHPCGELSEFVNRLTSTCCAIGESTQYIDLVAHCQGNVSS